MKSVGLTDHCFHVNIDALEIMNAFLIGYDKFTVHSLPQIILMVNF